MNITSGANHTADDIDIYCAGAMVVNFGSGRSFSSREILSANGLPKVVYAADKGQLLSRLNGTPSALLYFKIADIEKTGWIAIA